MSDGTPFTVYGEHPYEGEPRFADQGDKPDSRASGCSEGGQAMSEEGEEEEQDEEVDESLQVAMEGDSLLEREGLEWARHCFDERNSSSGN